MSSLPPESLPLRRRSRPACRLAPWLAIGMAAAAATGCHHAHQPPPRAAAAIPGAVPDGEAVADEVVVTLDDGAAPPERLAERTCQAGAWASARVVVLHCAPRPTPAADDTARLVEAARAAAGVRTADFNWRRSASAR